MLFLFEQPSNVKMAEEEEVGDPLQRLPTDAACDSSDWKTISDDLYQVLVPVHNDLSNNVISPYKAEEKIVLCTIDVLSRFNALNKKLLRFKSNGPHRISSQQKQREKITAMKNALSKI